jgi:protocatechuate 3,4-dioxygenase beta subunit
MTRRTAITALCAVAAAAVTPFLSAQQPPPGYIDPDFVRMYAIAQRQKPANPPVVARIAPAAEPGAPLTVLVQLFGPDGKTPLIGVTVFAYQTDRTGVYGFTDETGWRLQGWATTDAEGRARFDTIRPGPYPNRREAAHIHVYAQGPNVPRQTLETIVFAGDPLLTTEQIARSGQLGRFGYICPVTPATADEHECQLRFRVTGEHIF